MRQALSNTQTRISNFAMKLQSYNVIVKLQSRPKAWKFKETRFFSEWYPGTLEFCLGWS